MSNPLHLSVRFDTKALIKGLHEQKRANMARFTDGSNANAVWKTPFVRGHAH
jgi:hypothetical protein